MKIKTRLEYILKHFKFIQKAYKFLFSNIIKFIGLFITVDEKMILFNSHGKKFNDSPKKIYQFLVNDNKYKDYKLVWALDNPENYNLPRCKKIEIDTFKYFYIALKSKYWISCVNIERGLNFKKNDTIYLNTWHGIPLKKIGNDVNNRNDFDFSDIDFFCSSGVYDTRIYENAFNLNYKNIFKTGLPRNDDLYNIDNNRVMRLKEKLNIPKNKKVILYAPTWRDSNDFGENYIFEPPINIDYWQQKLNDDYVLLFRTHSYTNKILNIKFNDFVRDFSNYSSVNDLLIISDILISDYSSIIFDFSILERPIICFGYDYNEYSSNRGFYIDLEKELPNGVIKKEKDVINKIKNLNYEKQKEKSASFRDKYLESYGNATEECVDLLFRN